MKIGVIGLGDIARKAYLPVITTRSIDIHLCSRDKEKLSTIGDQYRISNRHRDYRFVDQCRYQSRIRPYRYLIT